MDTYISGEVPIPEGDEAKSLYKKNLVKAKRIIADSIKDHIIPQVFSLKISKEMFDSLTKLFEWKNIIREENMGATEDQVLTIQRRSLKRRGI